MKKILLVINSLKKNMQGGHIAGGGSVVISNFLEQLTLLSSCQVFVITDKDGYFKIDNAKVVEFGFKADDKNFLKAVELDIKQNNYDCVFSFLDNNIFYNSFLQCHSSEYKCQNTPLFVRCFKKLSSVKKIKYQKKAFENFGKNCKLFAVSEKIKKDYVENLKLPAQNIITVYPAAKQPSEDYSFWEKNEKICFGVVANSAMNKGGHIFTFALGVLKMFGYDFKLKIIAPKFEKDFLLKFFVGIFGMKNNIEILNKQENMEYFYKSIDCLVLPSVNEAFGLVVLEAMTYSKPVLVSSNAGASEIINDGKNGFIFNRKSFWDFIKKLRNIIKLYQNDFELYKEISKQGCLTSKKYTWKNFTLKVIKSIFNDF